MPAATSLRVDVWAELYCPFCGLGDYRLRQALANFPHRAAVEVVHHSFQLDPGLPEDRVLAGVEYLRDAKGMDPDLIERANRDLERTAAAEGLAPYHVFDNVVGNTRLAHEFLAYATARGRNAAAWQALFDAYFGRRAPVFAIDDLLPVAAALDFDTEDVRAALRSGHYDGPVQEDRRAAAALGIQGVPFFVFDGRYAVVGAQPAAQLGAVLERAWTGQ